VAFSQFRANTYRIPGKENPMMKAWIVNKPGSLDNLQLVDLADPGAPAAGEIRVALHATSLNYHDLLVATG
jgi:NADPH:quinone reductase-like Zn-dependent oxidoreductase